jgi:LPS-assembly protein
MLKRLGFCILFFLYAVSGLSAFEQNNKIEITAKHIEGTKTSVHASENVLVYYQNTVIKANTAHYDKIKKVLVLDGNIELIGYNGSKEHANHMEIFTQKNEVTFDELFLVSDNDIWLFSGDVHKKDGNYTLGRSLLSSCDVNDPLWKMVFTKSLYDSEEKYMKVYDAKVYLWDVPVFYFPYLAFSTNNERSSGLLFPAMGYSKLEGFLYEQPIFWAISDSMDLEVNPQIRTNRSIGLYTTFRFADSAYSSGELRLGYFKDKSSYAQSENLPNDSHFGFEFNYESSKVFSDFIGKGYKDGLYVNATFLNDIDYLNLQQNSLKHFGLTPLQESRLNYFLHNNDYYMGLNAKYFIDTRDNVDKDETLQVLPSIQFHKYLDHFILENFTYSADFKINNFDRKKGTTMSQAELKVPLEFTVALFDDFLNISIGETFYYSKFFFGNGTFAYDDFQYYSNIHNIKFFTDLTKKYNDFVHVLQPSLEYIKPGSESQKPVDFSALATEQKELFTVGLPEEQYAFSLSQYFYDDSLNLKFYQRFTQNYYLDRKHHFADMSNEMQYNWKKWSFYNNIVYAHEYGKLRESSTRVTLTESEYYISLGHTYTEVLPDIPDATAANDVDLSFTYKYNDKIDFNGGLTYNIDEASSRQWRFGGSYHRDCWSVTASIRQDITPRPTGFTTDTSFYLQLNFIPFGGVGTGE